MTTPPPNPPGTTLPAVVAALLRLAERLPIPSIDELWFFPPHRVGAQESAVLVATTYEEEPERRRIFTARYTRHDARPAQTDIDIAEQGSAPMDRLGRVLDGVLRRLDDELPAAPPRVVAIHGAPERWAALQHELAGTSTPG